MVSNLAAPVIALLAGIWINRRFGDRVKLVSYFGHVSSFRHTPQGGQPLVVHTHSVVLHNAGRQAATNVRLSHQFLPDFNIWPPIQHSTEPLAGGGTDIVIPVLVPNEQITVSYLYFPPYTAQGINAGIKCDQGFAHPIPVLLQRQWPQWWNYLAFALFVLGLITVLYVTYEYGVRRVLTALY